MYPAMLPSIQSGVGRWTWKSIARMPPLYRERPDAWPATVMRGHNDPVRIRSGQGQPVEQFAVVVAAGSLRSEDSRAVRFPHRWTSEGVTVETEFTGAHLLHLAAAGCTYRFGVGLNR